MFLYHQFCEMAFTNGEKAAIVQEGQTISYRQLSRFVEIFSVILTEYGIKSNSRLAIFLQQDYDYFCQGCDLGLCPAGRRDSEQRIIRVFR